MRQNKTRANDSTFELNLAPVLDIIVAIIPMLLLSVAFIQVKMIEAPTPQVVSEQNANKDKEPEMQVALRVSNKSGFIFEVTDTAGKTTITSVSLSGGELDYDGLLKTAMRVKELNPKVTSLELNPDSDVSFDKIIKVIDQVREVPRISKKVSVSEAANEQPVQNQYLFPDVIFASVGG